MDDDISKAPASIADAIGVYSEIHPTIGPRLMAAMRSDNPEVAERMRALYRLLEQRDGQRAEALTKAWGLTRTEARLAIFLAGGGAVTSYAETFEVSVATARSQLKSIYGKTGVNRQAALAALVPRA